jgi:hypothetical protein
VIENINDTSIGIEARPKWPKAALAGRQSVNKPFFRVLRHWKREKAINQEEWPVQPQDVHDVHILEIFQIDRDWWQEMSKKAIGVCGNVSAAEKQEQSVE